MSPEDFAISVLFENQSDRDVFREYCSYGCVGDSPIKKIQFIRSDYFQCLNIAGSYMSEEVTLFQNIPLLYGVPKIRNDDDVIVIEADILATVFHLAADVEGVLSKKKDEHGRFPGKYSVRYRYGYHVRPIIDEYRVWLRNLLTSVGANLQSDQSQFRIVLSHDIDIPYRYQNYSSIVRTAASVLLGRQHASKLVDCIQCLIGQKKDPYDSFDMIFEQNSRLASASPYHVDSIYFIRADKESHYHISSQKIMSLIGRILIEGGHIGLHTGYEAGAQSRLIENELSNLESFPKIKVSKNRNHYLRWIGPDYAKELSRIGVTDDYSKGYADLIGFRLGTVRPLPCYDLEERVVLPLQLHSLAVMDCTLSDEKYMSLDSNEALEAVLQLAEDVRRYGGELSLLWHNQNLACGSPTYHRGLYKSLITKLAEL